MDTEAGSAADQELILFLLPPPPSTSLFSCLCSRCSAVPGCEHLTCECRCTLHHWCVCVAVPELSVLFPFSFPLLGFCSSRNLPGAPTFSLHGKKPLQFLLFLPALVLAPHHSVVSDTCADAWAADGPANGDGAVNLHYWGQFCCPSLWP